MKLSTPTVNVKKVDKLSQTRVRMEVEIPGDEVKSREQSTIQRIQKQAKIPGFRPGKAPIQMVKQRYEEQIEQDVVSNLLETGLTKAIEDKKLWPINRPKVSVKETGRNGNGNMLFEAEFEVRPEFKLKDYKGIKVKSAKVKVEEKEISESLDRIRDGFSTLEPKEGEKATKGDFVIAKVGFVMTDGDKKEHEAKEMTFQIGQDRLLPELEKVFDGMKVESKKEIEATFPEDYADKSLAGRKALFSCELLELKKKVLPDLDDAFADQVIKGKTLKDLREQVKKDIEMNKEAENKKQQRQEIVEALVKKHDFEVPASMVAQQTAAMAQQMEQDMKNRGIAFPEFKEEDVKHLKERAEFQVKSSLLLAEVAAVEKITLNEGELEKRIQGIAGQMGKPAEEAKQWLEAQGYLKQIREEVLTDQVFDFLLQSASLSR